MEEEQIIVAGLNEASQSFIRALQFRQLKFVVLTNSKQEAKQLRKHGITDVVFINSNDRNSWVPPVFRVREVFIFESSLALSCRFVQCCRSWTSEPIYVITQQWNPRAIYKGLGASHIVFTQTGEVSFLLNNK
ncbi:hypothetical protein FHS16_004340 [Paenibacillus endophyticus]|uniref:RCK N-terminal domain-containing protein n=1 Tax=Paenibacillus endophyticus TaxID=1294268 RepID=A0A7W5CAR7_9BACL|nr:hypothetical protein [Paenibacillus endophyticus]MBB3154258.1 hypothetical protein [Paenibacillus endophyticus]